MPITYHVDIEQWLVAVTISGDVTRAEFDAYFERIRTDPTVSSGMNRLVDLRAVSTLPSSEDLRNIGRILRSRAVEASVRYAVISRSDLATGVSMMVAGHAGLRDVMQVFRDEEEAVAWLASGGTLPSEEERLPHS